jgi:hypothetical protein
MLSGTFDPPPQNVIPSLVQGSQRNKSMAAADASRCAKEFVNHFGKGHWRAEKRASAESKIDHRTLRGVIRWQKVEKTEGI